MAADGKWNIGYSEGRGARAATIELAIAGSKVTGTFGNRGPGGQEILDGVVDGDKLRWKVESRDFAGPMTMTFEAQVEGDRIEGTIVTRQDTTPFRGVRADV